jgi:hypothetical protein
MMGHQRQRSGGSTRGGGHSQPASQQQPFIHPSPALQHQQQAATLHRLQARIVARTATVAEEITLAEQRRRAAVAARLAALRPVPEPEPEAEAVIAWRRCVATVGEERGGTWGAQRRALVAVYAATLAQPERDPTEVMLDAGGTMRALFVAATAVAIVSFAALLLAYVGSRFVFEVLLHRSVV